MKKKTYVILTFIFFVVLLVGIWGLKSSESEKPKDTTVSINKNETTTLSRKEEKESIKAEEESKKAEEEFLNMENPFYINNNKDADPDKIVETQIPLSFLEKKYQDDLDAYVRDKGYKSAKLSKDGKFVIVKKRSLTNDLELLNVGATTISALCEIFESEKFPYVVDLGEYKDDFSYVTYIVDEEKLKKTNNEYALYEYASDCCVYYLLQDIDAPDEYTIVIENEEGEELGRKTMNKNLYNGF